MKLDMFKTGLTQEEYQAKFGRPLHTNLTKKQRVFARSLLKTKSKIELYHLMANQNKVCGELHGVLEAYSFLEAYLAWNDYYGSCNHSSYDKQEIGFYCDQCRYKIPYWTTRDVYEILDEARDIANRWLYNNIRFDGRGVLL